MRNGSRPHARTKRRLRVPLTGLIAAGIAFGGCAIEAPPDPLKEETLAAGMDEICARTNQVFESFGIKGEDEAGIAAEHRDTAKVLRRLADDLEEPEVTRDAEPQLEAFVGATRKVANLDEKVAEAAARDDWRAMRAAQRERDAADAWRKGVAVSIGTHQCAERLPADVLLTGTGPSEEIEFAEPVNTVEQAARPLVRGWNGAKLAGTEQYGPVGQAEIVGPRGTRHPTYFIPTRSGRLYPFGRALHEYGGLRPAPADNDADEAVNDVLASIRAGDAKAFNATLADPDGPLRARKDGFAGIGPGGGPSELVTLLRETGVVAQPLGRNVTWAFYLVPGDEMDSVLVLAHQPGAGPHYRLEAIYSVPKRIRNP